MSQDYRIIFALSPHVPQANEPGTIVISPAEDNWNDFGYRIRAVLTIRSREAKGVERRSLSLSGFLSFLTTDGKQEDTRWLNTLRDRGVSHYSQEDVPEFFTMLPDISAYRTLVGDFGPHEARAILGACHDVVEAEDAPSTPSWLRQAIDLPAFQNGFLRDNEAYFAWKNAAPILDGLEFEEIGRISETLKIQFQLAGRTNEHELEFHFALHEAVLPKRFSVIIGKNGVGKSQSLSRIASAALRGSGDLKTQNGERPSFNRLLAFSGGALGLSVFPPERRRRAKVWYRRFSLSHPGMGRRRQSTADLIVQLARSSERIADRSRLDIFLRALKAIDNSESLALATRTDANQHTDRRAIRISEILRGGEQAKLERFASIEARAEPVRMIAGDVFDLSSGELSFVRFAALASLYVENSSLLLFDEPETHLHPNFISQFVALLDNLLEQTGSAAIIATHSVYFVREAFEDQVIVLRSGIDNQIEVATPTLKTFGADVGAISYFVFGEDQPSRLARDVERQISAEAKTWDEVFDQYKGELSLELLGDIRATLEDRDGGRAAT